MAEKDDFKEQDSGASMLECYHLLVMSSAMSILQCVCGSSTENTQSRRELGVAGLFINHVMLFDERTQKNHSEEYETNNRIKQNQESLRSQSEKSN